MRVLQLDPHAARRARSGGCHAAVEEDGHSLLLYLIPDRVEPLVVGVEVLASRVDLADAVHSQLLPAPLDLVDGDLPHPWVDGGESHEDVRVLLHCRCYMVVGQWL